MSHVKKVTIYRHNGGDAVYFDGVLEGYYKQFQTNGYVYLCRSLGIEVEYREVDWDDWRRGFLPPMSNGIFDQPKALAVVEKYFAELTERRRRAEIDRLKREIDRLEGRL